MHGAYPRVSMAVPFALRVFEQSRQQFRVNCIPPVWLDCMRIHAIDIARIECNPIEFIKYSAERYPIEGYNFAVNESDKTFAACLDSLAQQRGVMERAAR